MGGTKTKKQPTLEETKKLIRSVLLSSKDGIFGYRLESDYKEITGQKLPFKELGFPSLHKFILAVPDVVLVSNRLGEVTYHAVSDESTIHLEKMVAKQRPKKTKKKKITSYKGYRPYETAGQYMTSEVKRIRNRHLPPDIPNPLLDSLNRDTKDARPFKAKIVSEERKALMSAPRLVWHQTQRNIVSARRGHRAHQHTPACTSQPTKSLFYPIQRCNPTSTTRPVLRPKRVLPTVSNRNKNILSPRSFTGASKFKNPLMADSDDEYNIAPVPKRASLCPEINLDCTGFGENNVAEQLHSQKTKRTPEVRAEVETLGAYSDSNNNKVKSVKTEPTRSSRRKSASRFRNPLMTVSLSKLKSQLSEPIIKQEPIEQVDLSRIDIQIKTSTSDVFPHKKPVIKNESPSFLQLSRIKSEDPGTISTTASKVIENSSEAILKSIGRQSKCLNTSENTSPVISSDTSGSGKKRLKFVVRPKRRRSQSAVVKLPSPTALFESELPKVSQTDQKVEAGNISTHASPRVQNYQNIVQNYSPTKLKKDVNKDSTCAPNETRINFTKLGTSTPKCHSRPVLPENLDFSKGETDSVINIDSSNSEEVEISINAPSNLSLTSSLADTPKKGIIKKPSFKSAQISSPTKSLNVTFDLPSSFANKLSLIDENNNTSTRKNENLVTGISVDDSHSLSKMKRAAYVSSTRLPVKVEERQVS